MRIYQFLFLLVFSLGIQADEDYQFKQKLTLNTLAKTLWGDGQIITNKGALIAFDKHKQAWVKRYIVFQLTYDAESQYLLIGPSADDIFLTKTGQSTDSFFQETNVIFDGVKSVAMNAVIPGSGNFSHKTIFLQETQMTDQRSGFIFLGIHGHGFGKLRALPRKNLPFYEDPHYLRVEKIQNLNHKKDNVFERLAEFDVNKVLDLKMLGATFVNFLYQESSLYQKYKSKYFSPIGLKKRHLKPFVDLEQEVTDQWSGQRLLDAAVAVYKGSEVPSLNFIPAFKDYYDVDSLVAKLKLQKSSKWKKPFRRFCRFLQQDEQLDVQNLQRLWPILTPDNKKVFLGWFGVKNYWDFEHRYNWLKRPTPAPSFDRGPWLSQSRKHWGNSRSTFQNAKYEAYDKALNLCLGKQGCSREYCEVYQNGAKALAGGGYQGYAYSRCR